MPDISKITLPSGTTYDIKDATARSAIENLNSFSYSICTNAANTPYGVEWDNGGTTVTGTLVASADTLNKIYLVPATNGTKNIFDEYITINTTGSTYIWEKFGSTDVNLDNLGDMAYADTASASYTPGGSVSLTNSNVTATVSAAGSGEATYTPAGSVSLTNSNVTATVSAAGSGDATYTPAGSVSLSTTAATPTISGAAGTSGDNTFQCSGSVGAPTISVSSAGSTDTIHNPTKVTVAKTLATAAPGATAPQNAITYYSVSSETLSLYQIGYTTGDSITTSDVTVKTGDASYSASTPSFTGGYVKLTNGSINVPTSASFSGTGARLVTGNISVPSSASFSGTGARLVTGNISVPSSASFSGTAATITVNPDE